MFDVGLPEIAVLLLAALFVFGPDRLPTVVAQAARTLRQIRSLAAGARAEIDDAIGPELRDLGSGLGGLSEMEELRSLREELNGIRGLTPRKILDDTVPGGGATSSPAPAAPGEPALQAGVEPPAPPPPPPPPATYDADAT
jgi:sec-independent protein translocase protein TatB